MKLTKPIVSVVLAGVVACGVVLSTALRGETPAPNDEHVKKVEAALPASAPAKPKKERNVLVFTLATGFVHSSIPIGAKAVQMMGDKTGAYSSTISDDVSMFEPEKLKEFDAVVMVNTTGELFNDQPEERKKLLRESLLKFVSDGKGFVGFHAASDCSYHWPEYGDLIGGYFNGHPWGKVTLKLDDPAHPVNACFNGQPYEIEDEIYTFKDPWSRQKLRILASVDLQKSGIASGENRDDHDYGISWVKQHGMGRVFYCALGHREETYWNPVILQHYLAGIQFALGDLDGETAPSEKAK